MNDAALKPATQDIVVDEVFPHTPETIWKTLTTANLMGRWLMMPAGFEPVEGKHFTYQTREAPMRGRNIHRHVLEVTPNERFPFAWKGGDEGTLQYGSPLAPVVPFPPQTVENGTRLRLIHS